MRSVSLVGTDDLEFNRLTLESSELILSKLGGAKSGIGGCSGIDDKPALLVLLPREVLVVVAVAVPVAEVPVLVAVPLFAEAPVVKESLVMLSLSLLEAVEANTALLSINLLADGLFIERRSELFEVKLLGFEITEFFLDDGRLINSE